jgi:hypothetical protein
LIGINGQNCCYADAAMKETSIEQTVEIGAQSRILADQEARVRVLGPRAASLNQSRGRNSSKVRGEHDPPGSSGGDRACVVAAGARLSGH